MKRIIKITIKTNAFLTFKKVISLLLRPEIFFFLYLNETALEITFMNSTSHKVKFKQK